MLLNVWIICPESVCQSFSQNVDLYGASSWEFSEAFVSKHWGRLSPHTAATSHFGGPVRECHPWKTFEIKFLLSSALSAGKLTPVKVQNTTHFYSRLYCTHPARSSTKNGTPVIPTRIVMGHRTEGSENGTSHQKWDGWQPYPWRVMYVHTQRNHVSVARAGTRTSFK